MGETDTLSDRPKVQRHGAYMIIVGALLCFTLLGAPIGAVLVWWGYRKWQQGEQQRTDDAAAT